MGILMKQKDKREQDRLRTRTAILDAASTLMREEGYAAVTSRRVAERAGLKSQLVHYHFGSMDELFLDLLRQNDKVHFAKRLTALTSDDPLGNLWNQDRDQEGAELVVELTAAANHRKVLKDELAEAMLRFRLLYNTLISKYFEENSIEPGEHTPQVVSFLIMSVAARLISETSIGVTEGHDAVIAFMESLMRKLSCQKVSG